MSNANEEPEDEGGPIKDSPQPNDVSDTNQPFGTVRDFRDPSKVTSIPLI